MILFCKKNNTQIANNFKAYSVIKNVPFSRLIIAQRSKIINNRNKNEAIIKGDLILIAWQ